VYILPLTELLQAKGKTGNISYLLVDFGRRYIFLILFGGDRFTSPFHGQIVMVGFVSP
jgi:hypothetical protein